jgi:hypothetical protein
MTAASPRGFIARTGVLPPPPLRVMVSGGPN